MGFIENIIHSIKKCVHSVAFGRPSLHAVQCDEFLLVCCSSCGQC